uniref:ABC transporter domain-containing protein n=1 Tax=Polytomella parva TaxID=51329 RepID=A0A7S0V9H2_9CHLO|mmetsp:Transcript_32868/g.59544  ORF Transcript_32868/g.59544 Transcript_32868/m.59544 type:complete len:333 (+) Transcript_32868:31-1029(+)
MNIVVHVDNLSFSYPEGYEAIKQCIFSLPKGSRCLLAGENGAGKTTLLQLLAGKYMVSKESISILGRPPFHDMKLTCSGQLSYLGNSWRKDTCFSGYGATYQGDISAGKMIFGVEGVDEHRRMRLIEMLDIDLYQRLSTMSDGQRRRVQICMGLLKPYDVLLLDEITVDLDVLARLRLLDFFRSECHERQATIVYSTHIFDGLDDWTTHILFVHRGHVVRFGGFNELVAKAMEEENEDEGRKGRGRLLRIISHWMIDGDESVSAIEAQKEIAEREASVQVMKKNTEAESVAVVGREEEERKKQKEIIASIVPSLLVPHIPLGMGSRHNAYYR